MVRWAMPHTLQSLIDDRFEVTAWCQNNRCNHHARLDIGALHARLGPDAPAMHSDLAPRLRCAKCGGKAVGLIYSPDMRPFHSRQPG